MKRQICNCTDPDKVNKHSAHAGWCASLSQTPARGIANVPRYSRATKLYAPDDSGMEQKASGEYVRVCNYEDAIAERDARIAKLEDGLRRRVNECPECNGFEQVQIASDCVGGEIIPVCEPCISCADIRALLRNNQESVK